MAILPPYDPNDKPDDPPYEGMGGAGAPSPEVQFVTRKEAHPEDRVTFADTMAMFAAIGCAQALRLVIIAAAIGIIVLVIVIASHI